MIWLAGQLWPLLLVSFLLGAATVVLWGQRRESVEVWEDVPVPAGHEDRSGSGAEVSAGPQRSDGTPDDATSPPAAAAGPPVPIDADDPDSPFPVAAATGPAPWEADELWSRPARVGAQGEARRPKDEWSEAAENWRSWADEATGRGFAGAPAGDAPVSARDRDLFAADREVETPDAGHDEPADVFPAGPEGTAAEEDGFPYARPMEAPAGGERTMDAMDPSNSDEMTDDEREAAEIRRMREQARRGDGA